jgi:GNAT superfamily N-acetyltransferase
MLGQGLEEASREHMYVAYQVGDSSPGHAAAFQRLDVGRAAYVVLMEWNLIHGETSLGIRRARRQDVPAIVALLADDEIGAGRENSANLPPYESAFAAIDADPNQLLVVVDAPAPSEGPIATLQLSFIPCMSRQGATRALIESVRVARSWRGGGLGRALLQWALAAARERGCGLAQLTTDRRRTDALRFYESLGFVASHIGCKQDLD